MKRPWCPDGKVRYADEAEAEAAMAEFPGNFRTYECVCESWHFYDRDKKRRKDEARESRNARRKRRKRELKIEAQREVRGPDAAVREV
ncbi:hypothetical protein GCM10010282_50340 [Streptomyces roseolus]|nr:hypothetical protein GCM10010282_50340 [Streptomyces roseolus]